jgi:hypothetical protein
MYECVAQGSSWTMRNKLQDTVRIVAFFGLIHPNLPTFSELISIISSKGCRYQLPPQPPPPPLHVTLGLHPRRTLAPKESIFRRQVCLSRDFLGSPWYFMEISVYMKHLTNKMIHKSKPYATGRGKCISVQRDTRYHWCEPDHSPPTRPEAKYASTYTTIPSIRLYGVALT